jgi:16S rRNA (cytidine1402-2'-O)-methyltransferase
MAGKLFVVPTPVGNLKDMTFRAVEVLQAVDLILAEDTRVSSKLLQHFEISTPFISHHQHNEHQTVNGLVKRMQLGETFALISDAGTPAISDPGYLLVRACVQEQIEVDCLPGATALIPALVNSGLPCDRFVFEGFLPLKKGRQSRLEALAQEDRTVVLYESPHKVLKTLTQCVAIFGGDRPASISRELSKKFEETIRGSLDDLVGHFTENDPKGEFVLVIAAATKK